MKIPVKVNATDTFLSAPLTQVDLLPKNYKLNMDPKGNLFLRDFDPFTLPSKLYGESLDKLTNRVLNTFRKTNKGVGVLLTGLKGTGKSVQLKHISINSNMPVIVIDQPYGGSALLDFLNDLPVPCVILIDEFEKVYREQESQESILPVLDGLSTSSHVFVLTVNGSVNEYLLGRPSRIRYVKDYRSLDQSVVSEILRDLLNDKSRVSEAENFLMSLAELNIDTIVSLITEINLYPELTMSEITGVFNLEDPLEGMFDILYSTPVLVSSDSKEGLGERQEAHNFLREKFEITQINYLSQIQDKELRLKNEKIMDEIIQQYPTIKKIQYVAKDVEHSLKSFIYELTNGKPEIYLEKYWDSGKPQEHSICMGYIEGYHLVERGEITVKPSGRDFEIYWNGNLFAKAVRVSNFFFTRA